MSASVRYADVERMLEACAPGFTVRRTTHGRSICYGGKTYRNFPKHDDIELGHVRKMARHFGILECAKKQNVA
jgi:hypothetical protein